MSEKKEKKKGLFSFGGKKKKRAERLFENILVDTELYAEFANFLSKQYAAENLEFYKDVTQYANSGLDKKKLCKEAKRICDKYLGTGSDAPVINLHNLIVKQIMNELKNATPQLFDAARQDVEALLRTSFIQFAAEA